MPRNNRVNRQTQHRKAIESNSGLEPMTLLAVRQQHLNTLHKSTQCVLAAKDLSPPIICYYLLY